MAGSAASAPRAACSLLGRRRVVALGVGFIGRKLIRDERQRQLTYRRQQAKMSCRRYLDEANFVIEKDCLDSLRRTRRELRDEFQARAGVLHASSQRALTVGRARAPRSTPQEREQRAAELAARRAEIERLGSGARGVPGGGVTSAVPAGRPADRRGPRAGRAGPGPGARPDVARPAGRGRRAAVRARSGWRSPAG